MILLHQVHLLKPNTATKFEELTRDLLLPQIASETARFAFYAVPTGAAIHQDEVITMIALEDGRALGEFSERVRGGDLTGTVSQLASLQTDVTTRFLKPLDYDPAKLRLEDIPVSLTTKLAVSYMHDFVPPVIGQNRAYVDMMRERYMALTETELSGVVLRYSWETVWGGGPVPEMFNLSEIRSPNALLQLVGKEIPGEYKQIGSWMWDALGVRDRWTTRLLRSATWSPIS